MRILAHRSVWLGLLVLLCTLTPAPARADYSFSPNAQGRAQCKAIFSGAVLAVGKVDDLDGDMELWASSVRVQRIEKGSKLMPGMVIVLYYACAHPPAVVACPAQVRLDVGDSRAFFAVAQDLPSRPGVLYLPSAEHVRSATAI